MNEARFALRDYGDEHASGGLGEARHRRQEADGGAKGAERVSDTRLNGGDGGLEGINLRQVQFDQESMMVRDTTMEGIQQVGAANLQSISLMTCVSFRLASSSVF